MKKLLITLFASAVLFASCTTITPLCATGNAVGSKVGEATGKYLFGYLPLSDIDISIKKAAENGNITKISTVDTKTTMGAFVTTITTVVTGE